MYVAHIKCAYMEHIYIHTTLCVYICTCNTQNVHICTYTYMHIHIVQCQYAHLFIHIYVSMHTFSYTYMHIHIVQCQYAHLFEGALGLVELIAREDSGLVQFDLIGFNLVPFLGRSRPCRAHRGGRIRRRKLLLDIGVFSKKKKDSTQEAVAGYRGFLKKKGFDAGSCCWIQGFSQKSVYIVVFFCPNSRSLLPLQQVPFDTFLV